MKSFIGDGFHSSLKDHEIEEKATRWRRTANGERGMV
jgi:hypothetical protein